MAYIDDMDPAAPLNTDLVSGGAGELRDIKTDTQGSFPNLGQAAVTKTAAEINDLVVPADLGALALLDTVSATEIDTDAVTTIKIEDNAVTSDKIAGSAVGTPEIASGAVGAEIAAMGIGAIGTYAFAYQTTGDYGAGDTIAGTLLTYIGTDASNLSGTGSPGVGTWRCQGYSFNGNATLWLRIS